MSRKKVIILPAIALVLIGCSLFYFIGRSRPASKGANNSNHVYEKSSLEEKATAMGEGDNSKAVSQKGNGDDSKAVSQKEKELKSWTSNVVGDNVIDIITGKDYVLYYTFDQITLLNKSDGAEKWTLPVKWNGEAALRMGAVHGKTLDVYDGVVYYSNKDKVVGVDLNTGKEVWSYKDPYSFEFMGIKVSSGILYASSSDSNLYAINIKEGKSLWKYNMESPSTDFIDVQDNLVYCSSYKKIDAIYSASGRCKWSMRKSDDIVNSMLAVTALISDKDRIYISYTDYMKMTSILKVYDKKDGKEIFTFKGLGMVSNLVISEDKVLFANVTYEKDIQNPAIEFSVYEKTHYNKLYAIKSNNEYGSFSVAGDVIYMTCKGGIKLLDISNGKEKGMFKLDIDSGLSPIVEKDSITLLGIKQKKESSEGFNYYIYHLE